MGRDTYLVAINNIAYLGIENLYNNRAPLSGAVAHLGERFNGIEEVESSILSSSTIYSGATHPKVTTPHPLIGNTFYLSVTRSVTN